MILTPRQIEAMHGVLSSLPMPLQRVSLIHHPDDEDGTEGTVYLSFSTGKYQNTYAINEMGGVNRL